METIINNTFLGKQINYKQTFFSITEDSSYKALYRAEEWLEDNGYVYGMLDGNLPIAVQKGPDFSYYSLPDTWSEFNDEDKSVVDGVLLSEDFENNNVILLLF